MSRNKILNETGYPNMFEDETPESLRAKLNEYNARAAQNAESWPLPPGAPSGLTPAQQQTLHQNWVDYLYENKSPQTWTDLEKTAIRFAANKVLRGL